MAAHDSTARALALSVSPLQSPNVPQHPTNTPWTRRSSQMASRNQSFHGRREATLKGKFIENAERLQRQILRSVKKLTLLQKVLSVIALVGAIVFGILFLVFNERIFAWLEPYAEKWKNLRFGWLILWGMTFITAFPPIIGYSSCLTIAGFVFGFPGWFIVSTATVAGSLCSFIVSRTLLSRFVHRLVANDNRFVALSSVLKHDGLKLLCMIRLCPLPYSISNGAMSTFDTVKPSTFTLATALITPKLMIHIFIGTRLAAIAKSGEKMDTTTKAINWGSVIGGMIIGALTGFFIYRRTIARSQQIEADERSSIRQSATRSRGSPDDTDEQGLAATLLRDDQIDFLDPESNQDEYRDEFTDDEAEAFGFGDGDEEEAIGLDRQPKR